jgi:hypothetical protein
MAQNSFPSLPFYPQSIAISPKNQPPEALFCRARPTKKAPEGPVFRAQAEGATYRVVRQVRAIVTRLLAAVIIPRL